MKRRAFLGLISASAASALVTPASANNTLRTVGNDFSPATALSSDEAVRFIVFGDSGKGDTAQYKLGHMMAVHQWDQSFDVALMCGDNIYPGGDPEDLPAKFEQPYADLLKRGVSFYAALGNHDVKKGREAQMNYRHFNMGGRAYYSFTKGDGLVEFFAVDSTFSPSASSAGWKRRFRRRRRNGRSPSFIIRSIHRPIGTDRNWSCAPILNRSWSGTAWTWFSRATITFTSE